MEQSYVSSSFEKSIRPHNFHGIFYQSKYLYSMNEIIKDIMKKKIIIFNSTGGGGHIAVTRALESYLCDQYTVQSITILQDLLRSIDPGHILTFGRHSGEEAYNYLIRNKAYRLLNLSSILASWYFSFRTAKMEKLIVAYLQKEKPDIIISVAPFFNGALLSAAQKLNIPFLLIPTDLDVTIFLYGISQQPEYDKFRLALPFNDVDITHKISCHFKPNQVVTTGFPLRPTFFETKDSATIKSAYKIPVEKPIVLVVMGSEGSTSSYLFAYNLTRISQPAHFIFCLGRNEKIKSKIESLRFPAHVSYTLLGYTEDIASLMFIADLIITKSGSVSFCEALYTHKKILLDGTSNVLRWERFNHHFLKKYGLGTSIQTAQEIPMLVERFLSSGHLSMPKKNLEMKNARFTIPTIIEELLNNK
jgi:processive 1,2-diacylglycerol beta-glucosyltransferase